MDRKEVRLGKWAYIMAFVITLVTAGLLMHEVSAANPTGPDSIDLISNVSKNSTTAKMLNVTGGRLVTLGINATIQNVRWKAFVGNVTGRFTLMDPEGAAVYDWAIASMTGRIYATVNSSAISWATVNCSNVTLLETENVRLNHTRADDNITKTFNASGTGTHDEFYVGNRHIAANDCPTLNTYVNSLGQDISFEEVALSDGSNNIYAALLESDIAGYNSYKYDFQMIVPEVGLSDFSGSTAYYIYVEIG